MSSWGSLPSGREVAGRPLPPWPTPEIKLFTLAEQDKMQSQLVAQFMPFFRIIARILTLCDKKYRILTFRDKKYCMLTFRDKKYRILMFCDKTESYLTVLQQNNADEC